MTSNSLSPIPAKAKELMRAAAKLGFTRTRQRGSHARWQNLDGRVAPPQNRPAKPRPCVDRDSSTRRASCWGVQCNVSELSRDRARFVAEKLSGRSFSAGTSSAMVGLRGSNAPNGRHGGCRRRAGLSRPGRLQAAEVELGFLGNDQRPGRRLLEVKAVKHVVGSSIAGRERFQAIAPLDQL